jgi:hypothetical protein
LRVPSSKNDEGDNANDVTRIPVDEKGSGGDLLAALQELMGNRFDVAGRTSLRACEAMGWAVMEDGGITEPLLTEELQGVAGGLLSRCEECAAGGGGSIEGGNP